MGTLSGPATACVLRRQRDVFDDESFERLGSISLVHPYSLRHSAGYCNQHVVLTKTQPTKNTKIGVRKASAPEVRAKFIRIDSVHQRDLDGIKWLYHINAVDCVTQWQVGASVRTISEAHLLSVIEEMLAQFPFEILRFHADNGSEYVNHKVARLLDKPRIKFTLSRPRHSNDNGLAETKNNPVVRKEFGVRAHPPPPRLFATELVDPKKPGRIKRVYHPRDAMTPLDKLASLPGAAKRIGITNAIFRPQGTPGSTPSMANQGHHWRRVQWKCRRGCVPSWG